MNRAPSIVAWTAILLLALAVRAAPLAAGRPYTNYVDEGNLLHHVGRLVRQGGWDPGWYGYPQLPMIAAAAGARLYAPVYASLHGRPMRKHLSAGRRLYDVLEPYELIVIGRLLSLLAGLGIVVLTGVFAQRLAGSPAGLFAAFLAALTPALAIRGAIATVDPYAALFALACLLFTDRARTSPRPGLESLAAGAMAGFAFASKYPALLVSLAFSTTTLLDGIAWREKLRRLVLAGTAAAAGALAAMPALLTNADKVLAAFLRQSRMYARRPPEDTLWRQALLRAEWDLPYEHPELGIVFLALAAAGLAVALRDRRIARTAAGWVVFLAAALLVFARQSFQPFRNLLPLVPVGCLAAAILFSKVRERLRRPLWADLGAVALVLLAYGPPLAGYARERYQLRDSRTQAVDWLVEHAGPEDRVLVSEELAFVKGELARLKTRPIVRRWGAAAPVLRGRRPRFVVAGVLLKPDGGAVDAAASPLVRRRYRLRASFGEQPTPAKDGWWHGNRQIVYVLELRPRRPREAADL